MNEDKRGSGRKLAEGFTVADQWKGCRMNVGSTQTDGFTQMNSRIAEKKGDYPV